MDLTLADVEPLAAGLILKAGRRYAADSISRGRAARDARLNGFAQVAADLLHLCATPFAFEQAIREALAALPPPGVSCSSPATAAVERQGWEAAFVLHVASTLA